MASFPTVRITPVWTCVWKPLRLNVVRPDTQIRRHVSALRIGRHWRHSTRLPPELSVTATEMLPVPTCALSGRHIVAIAARQTTKISSLWKGCRCLDTMLIWRAEDVVGSAPCSQTPRCYPKPRRVFQSIFPLSKVKDQLANFLKPEF
jgi:hypothetical protein